MTTPDKLCSEDGCDKPVGKGLSICSTHYGRKRRGSKKTGPINPYGNDLVQVPAPNLTSKIKMALIATAKHNDISHYDVQRRLIRDWLAKFERNEFPYLCTDALSAPPVADTTPRVQGTVIRLTPAEVVQLDKAVEASQPRPGAGRQIFRHSLIIQIFEDWFRFWQNREHEDGVAFTISPLGPMPNNKPPPIGPPKSLRIERPIRNRRT